MSKRRIEVNRLACTVPTVTFEARDRMVAMINGSSPFRTSWTLSKQSGALRRWEAHFRATFNQRRFDAYDFCGLA